MTTVLTDIDNAHAASSRQAERRGTPASTARSVIGSPAIMPIIRISAMPSGRASSQASGFRVGPHRKSRDGQQQQSDRRRDRHTRSTGSLRSSIAPRTCKPSPRRKAGPSPTPGSPSGPLGPTGLSSRLSPTPPPATESSPPSAGWDGPATIFCSSRTSAPEPQFDPARTLCSSHTRSGIAGKSTRQPRPPERTQPVPARATVIPTAPGLPPPRAASSTAVHGVICGQEANTRVNRSLPVAQPIQFTRWRDNTTATALTRPLGRPAPPAAAGSVLVHQSSPKVPSPPPKRPVAIFSRIHAQTHCVPPLSR